MTLLTAVLPFLNDEELREMAAPLKQPAAIVRWFRQQGFVVRVKPNGMPLVSRTYFDAVMDFSSRSATATALDVPGASNTPNVAALLRLFGKNVNYSDGTQKKR
jgi:Domain of unknown function (DUF4224)